LQRLTRNELIGSVETAAVAEVAYLDGDGLPRVLTVTPLLLGGNPAFTLTYADSTVACEIDRSPQVSLIFSDSRLAYIGWNSLAVTATVEVTPDPAGELFLEKLLDQELRKFPPSRLLIDSPLMRREHWWYMPRWIFRLKKTEDPKPLIRRTGSDQGVPVWRTGGGLATDTVRVDDWDAELVAVSALISRSPGPPDGTPAALFYHDFSIPDMDQRTAFLAAGRLRDGHLSVTGRTGSRVLGRRPGIFTRLLALRTLKKRCQAGIERHT
jgi:hypothetical protein